MTQSRTDSAQIRSKPIRLHRAFPRFSWWLVASVLGAVSSIHGQDSWKEWIARGYLPYHRLVSADFPIKDKTRPKAAMTTAAFIKYNCKYDCTENGAPTGGFIARVTEWKVRSGLNRTRSSRKSWYKDLKWGLLHEQGHLDINELHSRHLANMGLDMLPIGEGANAAAAAEDLEIKLKALAAKVSKDCETEQNAYDAKTVHGTNMPKQMAATVAIRKRLKEAGITYRSQSSGD